MIVTIGSITRKVFRTHCSAHQHSSSRLRFSVVPAFFLLFGHVEPAVCCYEGIQRDQYHSAQTLNESGSHECVLAYIHQRSLTSVSCLILVLHRRRLIGHSSDNDNAKLVIPSSISLSPIAILIVLNVESAAKVSTLRLPWGHISSPNTISVGSAHSTLVALQ